MIMAGAIKQISVEHGLDPRDFVLFCYGGGGPLHASALARELSIPTVDHPARARQFLRDRHAARRCAARSVEDLRRHLDESTVAALNGAFAEMEEEARVALVREFGASDVLFERHAEMRYVGQRHNIKVPISNY